MPGGEAAAANSAGHAAMKAGDAATAARQFARAVALAPDAFDFRLNHAIALNAVGRPAEALQALRRVEDTGRANAAYCSTRGTVERALGDKAGAAQWYDLALALDPQRPRALHGRARTAIERGEPDALVRFDQALAANPADPDLWLGKAQALDALGQRADARALMEQIAAQAPAWGEGLRFLAQLRLAAGESDFAAHYAEAVERVPGDPGLPVEWARVLSGHDRNGEAAEVMARARAAFPDMPRLALLHAGYLSASGDDAQAEALFAASTLEDEERLVQEGRHALRRGDLMRAETVLSRALALNPDSIAGWALRDLGWRLSGDARHDWLHGQDGLVRMVPLRDADKVLPPAIARLHDLHDSASFPLGQSLRGGTQTRGLLFDRHEPEFAALHGAIRDTLDDYRNNLPPHDAAHPLLKHRDRQWHVTGSWSVRLSHGGDHHAPHLHPEGIVSSACYCELPGEAAMATHERAGWIELGRPAPDLRLDLQPIVSLEPVEGHLALFPSTLYHGTRPFPRGRRMTVAFDATANQGMRR
ncbi:tetratricopeptide repeat protein [Erythrobacter arachoides]|uniref:Tetratricopeptide repeat protein n=1 Tax=Aurantiacibacter arachoides TaxID=1850444 RepID=A0A845A1I8_9SPHN|nr:tetratricopeptide repeat protein [Aurantiacibacter arachoides]MXO93430.1 tetratricopeptide repeat protein [Aurantiacibacter arachoides]GGD49462.1 hypothetical protein GCM10011411_06520 [Aurantiacibacter arachoides]